MKSKRSSYGISSITEIKDFLSHLFAALRMTDAGGNARIRMTDAGGNARIRMTENEQVLQMIKYRRPDDEYRNRR